MQESNYAFDFGFEKSNEPEPDLSLYSGFIAYWESLMFIETSNVL